MKSIETYKFKGKRALIRVDFNVPLDDSFSIVDDSRILAALPTIKCVLEGGGVPILMSHLGRPKNGYTEQFSLRHLCQHLSELIGAEVLFANDCIGPEAESVVQAASECQVVLLENLRFHGGEKKGDDFFSKSLSKLGDVYINDAFGTAHRAHASTAIIANYFADEKMFGFLMNQEMLSLNTVLNESKKPFTAILGGAKITGKIEIINQLLNRVTNLIIGGGMAYTFIKATGGNIGASLIEEDRLELALKIMKNASDKGVQIYLPIDSINAQEISNDAPLKYTAINEIPTNWKGLDIGFKTIELFRNVILNSKTIMWNGPMGVFETTAFQEGTKEIAQAVSEATQNGAYSLVGGGDSVSAVNKFQLRDKISYVSTGGGGFFRIY